MDFMIKMNTLATLIYLKKDMNSLIAADNHFDLAYIRNYLARKGLNTTQYSEQYLKLVQDLLDDIVTIGNTVFVFYIDGNNYQITQMVSKKLKQIDSEFTIIWAGLVPKNYVDFVSNQDSHDILITGNLAENICRELLELVSAQPKGELDLVKNQSASRSRLSPYQNGNIQARLANNYGVRLDLSFLNESLGLESALVANQLVEDFRLFHSQGIQGKVEFLDRDILNCSELFTVLVDSLKSERYSFTFSGQVSLKNLTKCFLDTIIHNRFSHLKILVHDFNSDDTISQIREFHKTAVSNNLNITYSICLPHKNASRKVLNNFFQNVNDLVQLADRVKFILPEDSAATPNQIDFRCEYPLYKVKYLHLFQTSVRPENALVNGYISYLTGFYPYHFKGGNSKHIGVQKKHLDPETYRNLSEFLGINSAIICSSKEKKILQKENILYGANGDTLREKDGIFDFNKDAAWNQGTFLPHYHQVYKTDEKYIENLQIDDHYHTSQIKILRTPYIKANDLCLLDDYNFLSIHTQEDLDQFLNDVGNFVQTGKFRHLYEISSILMDGCRWGGSAHCTLTKLHRFNIDNEQNILPCEGCSKAIGNVSESYINVVGNALQITEEEQEIRGCNTCPVKDSCSKCAMLPDFMNREQYCEIRRKHSSINEYVTISNLIKSLYQNVSLFNKTDIRDVIVSTSFKTYLFSNDTNLRKGSPVKDHIYLIFLQKIPYIVESRSFRVLKINTAVAMVFEGLLKGASSELIKTELVDGFQIKDDQASALYKATIDKLIELNYLDHKKILVLN